MFQRMTGWVLFFILIVCQTLLSGPKASSAGKKKGPPAVKASKDENAMMSKKQRAAMIAFLLRGAREAQSRGDSVKVNALLFQARKIDPNLPTPGWVGKVFPSVSPGFEYETREKLIGRVRAAPRGEAFFALGEYVRKNPHDHEARKIFFQAAITAGDAAALQRAKASLPASAWQGESRIGLFQAVKWFVLVVLLGAMLYQVYLLLRDLNII